MFDFATMEEHLSKTAFKAMKATVKTGVPLDNATADVVAAAMKDWALSKGVKFFSHIFYPMTNITAEKHDGFIVTNSDGHAITGVHGSLLIKGEPDGSSFPNGSLRTTNEARGYTAWDPTSPAYIMHTPNGATLMIPSVFMAWTGEALDKKIPLLRSNAAMDQAAQRVLRLMGETDIDPSTQAAEPSRSTSSLTHISHSASRLAPRRPHPVRRSIAEGAEFDDHYFGAIPERVQVFMQDFEDKLYRLGVPAKTHHNEVAPGQFEIAPYFESANVAADHQQLMMTVMKSTAKAHGFMPAAREAICWGQRVGKARQLVCRQRHPRQPARSGVYAEPESGVPPLLRCRHSWRPLVRPLASVSDRLGEQRSPSGCQRGAARDHLGLPWRSARGGVQRHQGRKGHGRH
ncbi:MAG: glutamine synthetase III [Acidimicrobiales bacterium]